MGFLIMTITNDRKRELKWEAIDASFNLLEYYEELRGKELSDEERNYMHKTICRMAKHVGVNDHTDLDLQLS